MDKDIIPPGDSTALEVIFSTKSYSGLITKSPRIYYNQNSAYANVMIRTHVEQYTDSTSPLVISPARLDISQPTAIVRDSLSFSLENVTDQPVSISVVDCPADYIEPDLPLSVSARGTVEGVVRVRSGALDQSFEKSITIELDDTLETRFTIPVKRVYSPGG